MGPITEAPDAFVVWSAISVISAVLKKKVWVQRGTYKVFPNQYIVLVGPPGVGKGTAIHPAHAFIKEYKPELSNYLSDRITAPKIIEKLANGFQNQSVINGNIIVSKESTAVLFASELSTFLGSSDWMTSFLCDTWDRNEFEYDTKNKGSSHIKDMCVSLIGACVPNFIRQINGQQSGATEAINGGFTARTVFVFANDKSKRLAWPIALENIKCVSANGGKTGKETIAELRFDLEQIAQVKGEFSFSNDATTIFQQWYHIQKPEDCDSDVVRHFKSRQDVHIFKVAMCLAAANSDKLEIDQWCMETAITLVKGVLDTLDITFRGVGESTLSEATAKIQTYIERKGLATRRELIRDNHRHATLEDIERITRTLEICGIIRCFSQNGQQFYEYGTAKKKGINI
jgi:energy-coupling factor transporter ATP-binding protein EcfA2